MSGRTLERDLPPKSPPSKGGATEDRPLIEVMREVTEEARREIFRAWSPRPEKKRA